MPCSAATFFLNYRILSTPDKIGINSYFFLFSSRKKKSILKKK